MSQINISEYGGTIYGVSRETGHSVQDIINANNGIDIRRISGDTMINLPSNITNVPSEITNITNSITIQPGETLYGLSRKHGVTVSEIRAANSTLNPNNISSGTKINIPKKGSKPKPKPKPKPKSAIKQQKLKKQNNAKSSKNLDDYSSNKCKCKPVVIIDPGHGEIFNKYRDPGAIYKVGKKVIDTEKDIALLVSKSLKAELDNLGCIKSTHLTRTSDKGKEKRFVWRINKAKAVNAEIFISIHLNANDNKLAHGSSVLKHKSPNKKSNYLASSISNSYDHMKKNRGIKKQSVSVLRRFQQFKKNTAPACLIELGFITNSHDREKIKKDYNIIAKEIAEGVKKYVKNYHCK